MNPPANPPPPPDTNGIRPPLGTRVASKPHARNGGNPYPPETREMVYQLWENGGGEIGGYSALRTPQLLELRQQGHFPHMNTVKNWIKQRERTGHLLPKRATGNIFATREVDGQDLVNLTLIRLVRQKATIDEVRAYIHNRNPAVHPYSPSQIHRAEKRLGLSRKVGSTTSTEAHTPINLHKRDNYWNREFPFGVKGEETDNMIDIDECHLKLESQNRKYGKTTKQSRCDSRGMYKKGAGGVSVLMGISGLGGEQGLQFHQTFSEGGTDMYRFYCFMEDFIAFLEVNRPGQLFCFTMASEPVP